MTEYTAARTCAQQLQAIAEPTRLLIFDLLRTGPKNVSEVANALEIEIVNVSHHLGVLRGVGLVQHEKRGRFVIYSLAERATEGRDGTVLDLDWCRLVFPPR